MSDLCRKREGNGFQICLIQEKEKGSENDRIPSEKREKEKGHQIFPLHEKEKGVRKLLTCVGKERKKVIRFSYPSEGEGCVRK